jgi:hypothetical protein
MDAIPGLSQNGANSAPANSVAGRPSTNNNATIAHNNINNNGNDAINITNGTSANTGWKNPQPAVSALDAVPSRTISVPAAQQPISSVVSTSSNKEVPHNPWKVFQRTHNSPSPPPPLHATVQDGGMAYEDEYLRMQREQEPKWDYNQDMEFDNIDMPDDDAGWEVMSQPWMNGGEGSSKPNITGKSKDSSPPLIATLSPSRRTSFGRKNISLRAPHSQEKDKSRGEWEVDQLPKNKPSSGTRSSGRGNSDSDEHAAAGPSSPEPRDFMTEYRRKLEEQRASLEEQTKRTPVYDDFDQDHQDPFQDQDQEASDDEPINHKKRRTSPDSKNSPDGGHYPSRRRSQSFSTSYWNEEETKVDIKVEPGTLETLSKPGDDGLLSNDKDDDSMEPIEDLGRPETVAVRSLSPPLNIKVEVARTEVNNAVINLSSDDDNDDADGNGKTASRASSGEPASGSQRVQVKQEPGESPGSQRKPVSENYWAPVKQEETLLEFEMDDEDDFGGLAEVIPIIPLVELTQVEHEVRRGQEVKVKVKLLFIYLFF